MRWKQGAPTWSGVRGKWRSGPDKAPGRLDDVRQAPGQLQIPERVGRQPLEIVEFVVEDRLVGDPSRRKGHDQIVAAAGRTRNHLAPSRQIHDLYLERGFFVDFAVQG